MGSADFDDLFKLRGLGLKGVTKAFQGGHEGLFNLEDCGDVHDGGESIVRRGGHVDVVVGMDGLLGAHCTS